MKVTMALAKTTNGALKYEEHDAHGNVVNIMDSNIGVLYLRRSSEIGRISPAMITVTVDVAQQEG